MLIQPMMRVSSAIQLVSRGIAIICGKKRLSGLDGCVRKIVREHYCIPRPEAEKFRDHPEYGITYQGDNWAKTCRLMQEVGVVSPSGDFQPWIWRDHPRKMKQKVSGEFQGFLGKSKGLYEKHGLASPQDMEGNTLSLDVWSASRNEIHLDVDLKGGGRRKVFQPGHP